MRRRKKFLLFTSIALAAVSLIGCGGVQKDAGALAQGKELKSVEIGKVEKEQISHTAELSGILEASQDSTISFEVAGRILKLNKSVGDQVLMGDILGKLDDKDYRLSAEKSAAGVSQSKASLDKLSNGARPEEIYQSKLVVEKAQVNYDRAVDDAGKLEELYKNGKLTTNTKKSIHNEYISQNEAAVEKAKVNYDKAIDDTKKMEVLFQNGAISQDALDSTRLKLEVAKKDWQIAQASLQDNRDNTQTKVALAAKELDSAKSAYSLLLQGARIEDRKQTAALYEQQIIQKEQSDLSLEKTTLTTPLSGTIIEKMVNEGQLITAGTPVFRIADNNELKVILPVPDREIIGWKAGDRVTLDVYGQKREGYVKVIQPSTNSGTGTIGVEVRVSNQDHKWFVGQVVKAAHESLGIQGIFVPVQSVIRTGETKAYVFRMSGKKAIKTPVELGQLMGNKLEILSGLAEGDVVVTKGADRLFDGDSVEAIAGGKAQ